MSDVTPPAAVPDPSPVTAVDPAPATPVPSPPAVPSPPDVVVPDPSPVSGAPLGVIPKSTTATIFGQQPALILGLVQSVLVMLVSFGGLKGIGISGKADVAIVVGVLTALAAVYTAWRTNETVLSPLIQLFQAALSFGALYGLHLSASQQGMAIAIITTVVSFFHSSQTTAAPIGSFRVPPLSL